MFIEQDNLIFGTFFCQYKFNSSGREFLFSKNRDFEIENYFWKIKSLKLHVQLHVHTLKSSFRTVQRIIEPQHDDTRNQTNSFIFLFQS